MKQTICLMICLLLLPSLLTGCSSPVSGAEDVTAMPVDVEIREKMFLSQTNDIYLNLNDYLGKSIRYEGMFFSQPFGTNQEYNMVIRYGPGCCGSDGTVGFEVAWDDPSIIKPLDNDWVEVTGTLEQYEEDGYSYVRLHLLGMNKLDKRGVETVLQ